MQKQAPSPVYRFVRWLVKRIYPKTEVIGIENIPDEPAIFVGNHAKMNGPIMCELYFPVERYTWCAGQMMDRKEVPEYAFEDFWSHKPKYSRWFYRLLSHLIAPLAECIFTNANTIGVYRDGRIISTFKKTVKCLMDGAGVVIFPEHNEPYNHILCDFQDKFIDVAKLYYKKSGKEVPFVPIYLAPALHKMYIGKPIYFSSSNPMDAERQRIKEYLMQEITQIACSLPEHTVVPYPNIPKKEYPRNIPEEEHNETACG